jgi:NAD(P)-dependent dehydrogenase (short-subunit alcohol dehydrogenase family)
VTELEQKVIVVAGGATGIGAETARQLVAAGARVIVGDINEDGGRRTAEAIGEGARFVAFDISEEASVKALIDSAIATCGRLDGLFSNARRGIAAWPWI